MILAELEALAKTAAAERAAAEQRERAALVAAENARAEATAAAQRRAELANKLAECEAVESGCRDRLGEARLQAGGTARQVEAAADRAAAGDDAAGKSVIRLTDTQQLQDHLVLAHEKGTREAVEARELAERALAAHDAAVASRNGEQLEGMMQAEALRADAAFNAAAAAVLSVERLVDERRALRPREGWSPYWRHHLVHDVARDAALVALAPVERAYDVHGPTVSRGLRSMARVVGELVECWRAGRGEVEPAEQPPEAA